MRPQVSKRDQNGTKSLLFDANDIRLSHLPLPRQRSGGVIQVQRDDFHRLPAIEDGVGKKPFHEHSQATKRNPGHQSQADHNSAEKNRVEQIGRAHV